MKLYHYDNDGAFLNEADAKNKNPMRSGEYLIPRNATDISPPDVGDGFAPCFKGGGWVVVEDHRGEVAYNNLGDEVVVQFVGSWDYLCANYGIVAVSPSESPEKIRDNAWLAQTYEVREGVIITVRPPMVGKYDADVFLALLRKIQRGAAEFGEVTDVGGVKQRLSEVELEAAIASHDEQTETNYNVYYESINA